MVQAPDLTHALLELGVSSSGDLDEAQARQLIYGGDLELNLLELQAVSEEGLLRALGRATGRPVSALGPLPVEPLITAKVRAVVPEAVAGFAEDRTVLISLAGSPTSEEEGSLLAACHEWRSLVQLTTTLRLLEAQALLDGGSLERRVQSQLARSGQLLTRLQTAPPPASVPAAVAEPAPLPAVPPPVAGDSPVDSSLSELSRLVNPEGLKGGLPPPYVAVSTAATPAPESSSGEETAPPPAGYQELARSVMPPAEAPRAPSARPLSARPLSEHPLSAPPPEPAYSQKDVISDLTAARDKDTIVSAICRFCAQFFEYVAVFGVQANEARGLVASGPGRAADRLHDLRVPLDLPSTLSRVKETGQHRVARLRAGGLEGGLVRDLERPLGRAVLLLPVTVRDRTLLLIWADDGADDVDIEHALPALSIVRTAGAALERVLMERKRASRLARPSLVPGAWSSKPEPAPGASAPGVPDRTSAVPSAPPPAPVEAPAPPAVTPPIVPASGASGAGAKPVFESSPTRLGMSIPPAGSRPPGARSSPPEASPARRSNAPPSLERHQTKRDLAPPEARVSSPPKADSLGPQPEVPKKRKLSDSFSDVDARNRPSSSAPAAGESERPLVFPSDHPKTMKGFPADLRLKASLSPAPKGTTPLLSRRIVTVSEQSREEEAQTSGPSSAGTMFSRRAEETPQPRASERPPARPSPAPLSYRALVDQWVLGDEDALVRLVEGGESAVGALIAAFPGPTEEPKSQQTRASECGPVLRAIAAIGTRATPFLTVRTADSDAVVRRWAVFLLGELPGRDAARAIADRLLDETVDVRRAALASARRIQSDAVTRRTLRSRLEEMMRDAQLMTDERCAAVEAIADIREHESIPMLLQLLDDESTAIRRAARWALSVLTRHDFQEDAQKWRDFWQRHRNESRTEWLLLALKNTEADLARAAADEIESLLGAPVGDVAALTDEDVQRLREKLAQTRV